jgi:hypothetical protein
MVVSLPNTPVHRQDGLAQVCRLPRGTGLGADLEAAVLCNNCMGADARYLREGQDRQSMLGSEVIGPVATVTSPEMVTARAALR